MVLIMHLIESAAESVSHEVSTRVAEAESGPRAADAMRLDYMLNKEEEERRRRRRRRRTWQQAMIKPDLGILSGLCVGDQPPSCHLFILTCTYSNARFNLLSIFIKGQP
jgi:hypothetical protein